MTTRQDGPFQYLLRVRYAECDGQKVVFNARYAEYIELATTEFMRAMGLADTLIGGSYDYQLVKQTIEWKGSARFDDVVAVSVTTEAVGNTSFTTAHQFRIAGRSEVFARAETVYVMVSAESLEKVNIPDDLRVRLLQGARGHITDHAAYGHAPLCT